MEESEFRRQLEADGYTEQRWVDWPADTFNDTHSHDFDARVLICAGEISVTTDAGTFTCGPGDSHALRAGTPHTETVGPNGVRFLAGTKPAT